MTRSTGGYKYHTRRAMPLLPLRRGIPCLTERCDKVFLELVDELRREPLEVAALGLLVVAAAAFWRSKKRLCAVAILGAVATTTTPSTTIITPPHSRLRFVEPKTTEEQPARPAARRPSTRRLRFTKI